jgi:ribosomal protein S18 acetylase RimI-like enzyme
VELKKARPEDIWQLQRICIDTYSIYFADYWNEDGLEWYLDKQFGNEKLKADLHDDHVDYYIILDNNHPAGFVKINHHRQPDSPFDESAELEKIYVFPECKGRGLGKKVLTEVLAITRKRGKKIIFLGVLDTNLNAIAFYAKLGFKFHSKIQLSLPYFKDELRGLNLMYKELM